MKFQVILNIVGKIMDIISNLLNNIKNGITNKLKFVICTKSKQNVMILKLLQKESLITGFLVGKNIIKVFINLKINNLKIDRISKPSNKVFIQISKLRLLNQGAGISILSTKKGIMSDTKAKSLNLGGELICQII